MIASARPVKQTAFKANDRFGMDGTFPPENIRPPGEHKEGADRGVPGMSVPEEYGGLTQPIPGEAASVETVTAMAVLGEAGIQKPRDRRLCSKVDRAAYLHQVVSRDCISAVCVTKPQACTAVVNCRTNAAIVTDGVILSGTKTLMDTAREAGMLVLFTRVHGKPGRKRIGCVVVEPNTPGFPDENPVSRFYRGARYGPVDGGAPERLRDLINKNAVGDVANGIMGPGRF